jgi:hypothetical protein
VGVSGEVVLEVADEELSMVGNGKEDEDGARTTMANPRA